MSSEPQITSKLTRTNRRWNVLSLAPAVLLLLVLSVFPVFNLLGLSLYSITWADGVAQADFVGLENFRNSFPASRYSGRARSTQQSLPSRWFSSRWCWVFSWRWRCRGRAASGAAS